MSTKVHRPNHRPTLKEAQGLVGGYIEILYIAGGDQMVVNEEGLLLHLEPNHEASLLARRPIVGDVIVLSGPNMMD